LENTIASLHQTLYIDGSPIARLCPFDVPYIQRNIMKTCQRTREFVSRLISRLSVGDRDAIDYRTVFHLTAHAPSFFDLIKKPRLSIPRFFLSLRSRAPKAGDNRSWKSTEIEKCLTCNL